MADSRYNFTVSAEEYSAILLAVVVNLVVIHVGLFVYNYTVDELHWLLLQMFDLDDERNLPTWFSSFLLLNNAFFIFVYARSVKTRQKIYWQLLAVGFFLLAMDEVAGFHDTFNTAIDMNWAIFGGILVLFVATLLVPFLLSLPKKFALRLLVAGFLYVSGAVGVELMSEDMDAESVSYTLATALEEGLEMFGALMCLYTMLIEMQKNNRVDINLSVS
ncbi:MAG: hypothetical protein HKP32_04610 [Woeseia sp.]|nr:hypothetical protein [Woeseia sp.]NNL54415.1 hypothetical protein [Woeseia sp.]